MEKNDKERLDVIWNKGQVVKGTMKNVIERMLVGHG